MLIEDKLENTNTQQRKGKEKLPHILTTQIQPLLTFWLVPVFLFYFFIKGRDRRNYHMTCGIIWIDYSK